MVYKVAVHQFARLDAIEYAEFIARDNPAAADKWLTELAEKLSNLRTMPRRYPTIREQAKFNVDLRQFIHYSHRVVYQVDDDARAVRVLRIYHGHAQDLATEDIPQPE